MATAVNDRYMYESYITMKTVFELFYIQKIRLKHKA